MKYQNYSAEDFALDDDFRAYVLLPNEEQNSFWKKWLEENPQCAEEVEIARQMVLTLQFSEIEISEDKIDAVVASINRSIDEFEINTSVDKKHRIGWHSKFAAAVVVFMVSILTYHVFIRDYSKYLFKEQVVYVTKVVPLGQKKTITLGDGTKVKLNAGSTLRFPETFSDSIREVYLTGEAFFEVAENSNKPFIINSQGIETRVLGTSFNISAYPNSENVSVAVATGKVKVNLSNDSNRSVMLIPNQMYVYHKSKDMDFKTEDINLSDLLAWRDKRIVFRKSLHDEIIETLERWYGVNFVVNKKIETGTGYTAQFKPDESLQATLEHMKYSLGFDYKLENKTVTIN